MPLFSKTPDVARLKSSKDIPGLIQALAHKKTAMDAVKALGQMGKSAIRPLNEALSEICFGQRQEWIQAGAILALGEIAGSGVDAATREGILDQIEIVASRRDPRLGWAAAAALANIADAIDENASLTRILDRLTAIYDYGADNERSEVIVSLGRLEHIRNDPALYDRLVALLIKGLNDSNAQIREEAASTLGKVGDSRAIQPLEAASHDGEPRARRAATFALDKIRSREEHRTLLERRTRFFEEGVRAGSLKPIHRAFEEWQREFERQSRSISDREYDEFKATIAEQLTCVAEAHGAGPLVRALKEDPWRLSGEDLIFPLLGKFGNLETVKALLEFYRVDGWRSRHSEAIEAVVEIGGSETVDHLIHVLQDAHLDGRLRIFAAEALGKIGDTRAVEPLIACLRDSYLSLKGTAARALGALRDKRAVGPLIEELEALAGSAYSMGMDTGSLHSMAFALGELGDQAAAGAISAAIKVFPPGFDTSSLEMCLRKLRSDKDE